MKNFYTYLHCKPNGDPFYVGKGFAARAFKFSIRTQHHKNIVSKYGEGNIGVFVFSCESEEQAFADEIQQIAQLRKEGFTLVNLTNGGEGSTGCIASIETRMKLSAASLGRKQPPRSAEFKKIASISRIGKKINAEQRARQLSAINAKKGEKRKPPSEETKLKISAALTGKKRSLESRTKQSETTKGAKRPLSDEMKSRMIAWMAKGKLGNPNGRIGTKHSIESREKMKESQRNRWAASKVTTQPLRDK